MSVYVGCVLLSMAKRVGNSIPGATRRVCRLAFSMPGRKSNVSSSSARRNVCSTSWKSRGFVTGRALVSHTRKTLSTTLSPRGKMSALKIFNGTTANDPAIFASNRSRCHVQKVTTLCPCSGTIFQLIAGLSGNSPLPETFSRNDRKSFRCSTMSASALADIVEHLKLFRSFLENVSGRGEFPLNPAINWKIVPEQGHSVVTFCTWQRERLLAKIAGSFAVVPLNILSADIFPRGDNVVLSVFRVCDTNARPVTNPRDFQLVEQTLRRALEDETFDFLPGIEKAKRQTRRVAPGIEFPTRFAIDNNTHPTYTLIEIQAPDRIGLLYDVLSCLDRENILIPLSRINTQAGAAIDTLYVVDGSAHGKITDSHRIRTIQQHLKSAILTGGTAKPQ